MESWRKRTSDCGDVTVKLLVPNTNTDDLNSIRTWLTEKKEQEEYLYSDFIQRLVSKHSDMDHAVLPANYTMPAFPS